MSKKWLESRLRRTELRVSDPPARGGVPAGGGVAAAYRAVQREVRGQEDPRHGGAVGVGRREVLLEPRQLRRRGRGVWVYRHRNAERVQSPGPRKSNMQTSAPCNEKLTGQTGRPKHMGLTAIARRSNTALSEGLALSATRKKRHWERTGRVGLRLEGVHVQVSVRSSRPSELSATVVTAKNRPLLHSQRDEVNQPDVGREEARGVGRRSAVRPTGRGRAHSLPPHGHQT